MGGFNTHQWVVLAFMFLPILALCLSEFWFKYMFQDTVFEEMKWSQVIYLPWCRLVEKQSCRKLKPYGVSVCWILPSHLMVLLWMMLLDIKWGEWNALKFLVIRLWDSLDRMSRWCGGGVAYSPNCFQRMWSRVWGMRGMWWEGKEKSEVLMGNRQMACQCQKWSCAEERVEENERGRIEGGLDWLTCLPPWKCSRRHSD